MIRQYELVELVCSYDPKADEQALNAAYVYAMKAHGSQTRKSGDPYFMHPLEVAGILTEFKLDTASIITALLHDTIEDTDATLEDIEAHFGPEVSKLVDGVTKLTRIELRSGHKQAENFRKLLLAMSRDIRVLLVKLADRLHNMRTLGFIDNPEKRWRIATETLDIYVPLSERIGLQTIKTELENLAFAELNPDVHSTIVNRLHLLRSRGEDVIVKIVEEIQKIAEDAGIKAEVSGREKSPYSIWRKLQRPGREISLEQLSDVMAFRIIVDTVGDCYRALGAIHSAYRVVPGRFKDYISTPKPNGYQSIHTGLLGYDGHRIEVQIRTHSMHEVAEFGVAAHWIYKQKPGKNADGKQYRWLRELLEILEHTENPDEFIEHTKLEMFQDQVFCFSPKGDLISLPTGATAVDFAYAVHSEIGDTCVGVKVNGRMVALRTALKNGDQVEIVTSKAQTPSPTWERFVVTGKARTHIRRFVRLKQRSEHIVLGRSLLQRAFRQEGYEYTDKALDPVLKALHLSSVDDVCAEVGAGLRSTREILEAVFPGLRKNAEAKVAERALLDQATQADGKTTKGKAAKGKAKGKAGKGKAKDKDKSDKQAVPIVGLIPGMAVHFAGCCHALPGDRIVGIITTGKGVTIHTIDCDTLETLGDEPERWIDVGWNLSETEKEFHVGRVTVTLHNEMGSLASLSMTIAKNGGNISNLRLTNRMKDFFDMVVDIEVKDVKHLVNIIAALRALPAISAVERTRS